MEPFPQVPHGHQQQAHSRAYTTQCLNIHALGEQSDSDEEDSSETLSYRLKLRAADPRYITSSEDGKRGDVICTVEQVKELIARNATAEVRQRWASR